MQNITNELQKIMLDRVKTGFQAKPNFKVEVDRLSFIPGELQTVALDYADHILAGMVANNIGLGFHEGNIYTPSSSAILNPIQGRTFSRQDIYSDIGTNWGGTNTNRPTHRGIDFSFSGINGMPVIAVANGIIEQVGWDSIYGNRVVIRHGAEYTTLYAHLQDGSIPSSVKKGSSIYAGTVIGKVGSTGRSSGPHLHFEVVKSSTPQVPQNYLEGSKSLASDMYDFSSEPMYFAENIVFDETFNSPNWYGAGKFNVSPEFLSISRVEPSYASMYSSGSALVTEFSSTSLREVEMSANLSMRKVGVLDFNYSSNFEVSEGDKLEVFVEYYDNDEERYKEKLLTSVNMAVMPNTTAFAEHSVAGLKLEVTTSKVKFRYTWGGQGNKIFNLIHVRVIEARESSDMNTMHTYMKQLSDDLMGGELSYDRKIDIPTGRFVYMDTLVLPNVVSIEMQNSLEQESASVVITISNIEGFYSPDYLPLWFPNLYADSPWSYFSGGFQIGILSDNTPVRIYAGYGQDMARIFTGLIDKVDLISANNTMVIHCRDMYKKLIGKVLTQTKEYGTTVLGADYSSFSGQVYGNPTDQSYRRTTIIAVAKTQAHEWSKGGVSVDYRFLLALAQVETEMGTTGQGKESEGSYIVGYGINAPDKQRYAGVSNQLYYAAKRVYDGMGSRGGQINSLADVRRFNNEPGYPNDIGLIWTTDAGFAEKVWQAYSNIKANPGSWGG